MLKMDMEQIERIKQMESLFNYVSAAMNGLTSGTKVPNEVKDAVSILTEYYGSAEWKQDFEADEAGLLPKELKRGVLSEDGIWNLLSVWNAL